MFGIFNSVFGWLFSFIFNFTLSRAEDVFTWLLPIYMTVQCLRKKEVRKFNNYLSFWCLVSLLFGIDYITAFTLHHFYIYRIIRLSVLIWIELDNCHNSVELVNKFLTPVVDEHRKSIDDTFDMINSTVDSYSEQITDKAKAKLKTFANESGQTIMSGVFNLANTAQQSLSSVATSSTASKSDDKDNKDTNTIQEELEQNNDSTEATADSDDNKDKEN